MEYIKPVILLLVFALIGGQLSLKGKMPAIIGELIAGVILGPAVLNLLQPTSLIKSLAEIGVILLMFLAGLESDLPILKQVWFPSLLVAMIGMIVPILVAAVTGLFFHCSQIECLFLGITFAATSASISVAVLQELDRLKSKEGMTIIGAAVIDDLLSILMLSIVSSLIKTQSQAAAAKPGLGWQIFCQISYLFALILSSFWLAKRLPKFCSKIKLPSADSLIMMIIVLGAAFGAEYVGLSNVIGAFFVGLAFSQSQTKTALQHSFTTIGYSFSITIFFASIGLEMTLSGIGQNMSLFLFLLIGAILSKLTGAGIGAKLAGFSNLSSLQIGAGMASRGEMALIIAEIGRQHHLLTSSTYSIIVGVIILTTVIAPLFLKCFFYRSKVSSFKNKIFWHSVIKCYHRKRVF